MMIAREGGGGYQGQRQARVRHFTLPMPDGHVVENEDVVG